MDIIYKKVKKINIKFLVIALIIGVVLGAITECSLIFNFEHIIEVTQSFIFWGVIMLILSLCSKQYMTSILSPAITMTSMNATYYLIRFSMSGYTNIDAWKLYTLLGITASIYIGTFIYCIKEKIINKKINNYVPKISLIFMTLFAVICTIIHIYGIYKHVLIFGNYSYLPSVTGIIIGMILGLILGMYLNKKNGKI